MLIMVEVYYHHFIYYGKGCRLGSAGESCSSKDGAELHIALLLPISVIQTLLFNLLKLLHLPFNHLLEGFIVLLHLYHFVMQPVKAKLREQTHRGRVLLNKVDHTPGFPLGSCIGLTQPIKVLLQLVDIENASRCDRGCWGSDLGELGGHLDGRLRDCLGLISLHPHRLDHALIITEKGSRSLPE